MTRQSPEILLVNPWIHDFAAYDFWAKPLGLMALAGALRAVGIGVSVIDCLDRFHPEAPPQDPAARHGRGPYHKTSIPKPPGLEDIPRRFSRYGIGPDWLRRDLAAVPPPDLIMVTSLMTYWYPGVQATIAAVREVFPDTPVILGGIYATLCREHAERHSGADRVIPGDGFAAILPLLKSIADNDISTAIFDADDLDARPYPAWDLLRTLPYVPIMTAEGCPFSCAYCASRLLAPRRRLRSPERVAEEILHWHSLYRVRDFVFYDDALLVDARRHAIPLFRRIRELNPDIRFHTPNAIHIREITDETAEWMAAAGFHTLRLGLETTAFESRRHLDRKVTEAEFLRAVGCLKRAGFQRSRVGAYLLAGLPGQSLSAVFESIDLVNASGITPVPAYYSPIPGTRLWPEACASSRYDLAADPIFTNNAVFPCRPEGFSWEIITAIKDRVRSG